jgi:ABC-type bacteriocin/lantibiotic exporter with double-glycine peptidase domain
MIINEIGTTEAILGGLLVAVTVAAIFMTLKVITLRQRIKVLIVSLSRVQDIFNNTKEEEKDSEVHKENFIKFLSDSRDWAYEYIEHVQSGITQFVNEIEPEIAYFDEYGLVGDSYPHYHSMKKISQEYKELKKLLPSKDPE